MSFTDHERHRIAELADVLIPAAEGHLSASQANIAGQGLDQVLTTCPEMEQSLCDVLAKAGSTFAEQAVAELRQNDPDTFATLAEFAAGAYFLNPEVRKAIGYAGQTARPIDPAPDYLEDGLLESVIHRGPIYRPTPTSD